MRNTLKAKETNVRVDVTFSFYFVASRGYCDILSDLLVYHCKCIFIKIIGVWERIFFLQIYAIASNSFLCSTNVFLLYISMRNYAVL